MPKCSRCKGDTEIKPSIGFVHRDNGKVECPPGSIVPADASHPMPKYIVLGDDYVHEVLSNGRALKIAKLSDMVDVWRLNKD